MMPGKRCFFIGHRDAPDTLLPLLCRTIEQHIAEYSVTEFVVGHYGSFDHMAGKAVIKAKELYPEIALTLLLPYHPAEHLIEVPLGYDGTFYPPEMESVPRKAAIVRANRYMVDHSDYLAPVPRCKTKTPSAGAKMPHGGTFSVLPKRPPETSAFCTQSSSLTNRRRAV